ncbi:MAG: DUF4384 domain-containing protein [Muribaculaceae bacterium]|nr:DUF4384 domain-containing protein [Muribaculaceae bacterium]
MKHLIILMICGITFQIAVAQKTKNVSASYTYYAPETVSIEDAKKIAIERARIQAIADEFGTVISQNTSTVVSNKNGESDTQFFSFGGSDIKGEWVADTTTPEVSVTYEDNMLVVHAKVCGKAREKKTADFDLSIKTLCNRIESERFHNNDRLSVRFQTPVNGFLSIWLADDNLKKAYCLLPYENSNGEAREIKSKNDYELLSTADPQYPFREETILTTENDEEINRLIFIFSTKKFTMPLTNNGEYVPELALSKFTEWLQKNRIKDEYMNVTYRTIEIKK